MAKFGIFLLFQFRVIANGKSNKKRICEERIYNIKAKTAKKALKKAKKIGKNEEFAFQYDNKSVKFEFIGVVDIVDLSCLKGAEVWSRYIEKVLPMEKKKKIIPKVKNLTVFKNNQKKLKLLS